MILYDKILIIIISGADKNIDVGNFWKIKYKIPKKKQILVHICLSEESQRFLTISL